MYFWCIWLYWIQTALFLDKHKKVSLKGVFGHSTIGKKLGDIFQNLQHTSNVIITEYKDFNFDKIDLIFSCLPHGKLQKDIINNLDPKIPIIDLSGDFRLESKNEYEEFYDSSLTLMICKKFL